jgi:L-cysteine/cystine lyase
VEPWEQEKIQRIRNQLPAANSDIFLNTGTSGPLPIPVHQAMAAVETRDLEEGRASRPGFVKLANEIENTRIRLAEFLGAEPDELALTHHTTEGINIILWGLHWSPGDEIVTTTIEHNGVLIPLAQLRRRRGVTIRFADVGLGQPEEALSAIRRTLSPRTRLLVLSHVSYSTGAVLPLEDIVTLAHQHHISVLVDGAQAVGAIPVNLHRLGVDYYAFPGQKWLCGPEGTGGLFIRKDRLADIEPTFVGYRSMERYDRLSPYALPAAGAKRFEVGTLYRPIITGLGAAVQWLADEVGTDWAFSRIRAMTQLARQTLGQLPNVEIVTPESNQAGLLTFKLKNLPSPPFVEYALKQRVILRSIPDNGGLRISCSFFNTEEEMARLAELIRQYQG